MRKIASPRKANRGEAFEERKEITMQKYEVQIAVTVHGAVDVRAANETDAEKKAKEMLRAEKVKLADLEIGEERVECVGKVDGDDDDEAEVEGYICPLSQRPCDRECSAAEKANCDYHQGLCAAELDEKASAKLREWYEAVLAREKAERELNEARTVEERCRHCLVAAAMERFGCTEG